MKISDALTKTEKNALIKQAADSITGILKSKRYKLLIRDVPLDNVTTPRGKFLRLTKRGLIGLDELFVWLSLPDDRKNILIRADVDIDEIYHLMARLNLSR